VIIFVIEMLTLMFVIGEGLSHVSIRLHTSIPDGTFKLHRFHVERNNVRSKWFNSVDDADDATEGWCLLRGWLHLIRCAVSL
jgi:hypothetical protein